MRVERRKFKERRLRVYVPETVQKLWKVGTRDRREGSDSHRTTVVRVVRSSGLGNP